MLMLKIFALRTSWYDMDLQAYCCILDRNGWAFMMSLHEVLWYDADDERGSQS